MSKRKWPSVGAAILVTAAWSSREAWLAVYRWRRMRRTDLGGRPRLSPFWSVADQAARWVSLRRAGVVS